MRKNKFIVTLGMLFLFASPISSQSVEIDFIDVTGSENVKIGTNKYYYYKDLYKAKPEQIAYHYPETLIQLDSYQISKYLITDNLINQFMVKTGFDFKTFEEYPYLYGIFKENRQSQKIFGFGSYFECLCFCQWLSEKNKKVYRFPTNAEWEFACMEDDKNVWPFGAPDGKFESVKNEYDTDCIYLNYNQVTEDYSSKGVYSVYGSSQFVLDSYDGKLYSDLPKHCKNPLMLSESDLFNVRSAEWPYNSKNKVGWGLLKTGHINFNTNNGGCYTAIRLVIDNGTVFNKNTDMPFEFYQKVGRLVKNDGSELCRYISSETDVLILYKTVDDKKYYIFYKQDESWTSKWVDAEYFKIVNKKWYEIERD